MKTRTLSDRNRRHGKPAWLREDAGGSYERMKAVGLPADCVSDAGRTRAEQQAMYDAWIRTGRTNPPAVARPGTSLHETGIALDVREPARAWLHKYGRYYGWVNPAWAKRAATYEPWHFEWIGKDRSRHVRIKVTGVLDAATYRAISRAVARPRINRPSKPGGRRAFWRKVQRQVNRIMRGTKGWTPLTRDGFDGPKTWEGIRLSLRKVNRVHRPGKNASRATVIKAWQRALRAGKWGRSKREING